MPTPEYERRIHREAQARYIQKKRAEAAALVESKAQLERENAELRQKLVEAKAKARKR